MAVPRARPDLRVVVAALVLVAVLSVPSSNAGSPVEAMDLRYKAEAYGMDVGLIQILLEPDGTELRGKIAFKAEGLAALFSGAFSAFDTTVRYGEKQPSPVTFKADHSKSDRERAIDIAYDPEGKITSFSYLNNGKEASGDVPLAMREGTVDPVTAFLRVREYVRIRAAGVAAPDPTIPVFDGRKRYDVLPSYQGSSTVIVAGKALPAWTVTMRFMARAGFEPGDALMTFPDQDTGQYAVMQLSDDARLVPLQIKTVGDGSEAVVTLTGDCRAADPPRACAPLRP